MLPSHRLSGRMRSLNIVRRISFTAILALSGSLSGWTGQQPLPPPAKAFGTADATSWPMFRGSPSLLGVAPIDLPSSLKLLWTFKAGDAVKSSAAIVAGRVFIGCEDGNLYALNLADGAKKWAFKTDGGIESSPLVLDGKVYFGSSDGALYCVDAEKGEQVWKHQTDSKILGSPNWYRNAGESEVRIIVGSYDYKIHSVDAKTGKPAWAFETGNYINGTPAIAEGKTMFGGCDAILHVISLREGEKISEVPAGAYIAGSGAAVGSRVYIGQYDNQFLCIDIAEKKIVWTYEDRAFPFYSSPAVASDRVIFGGRDKRLHAVQRTDGKSIWNFPTQGKVDSSPVVCGDKVIVGSDDGRLYLVSLQDGKELWKYDIGSPIASSPAVVTGKVVIGSEDGGVYAFGPR